jgi:hypothetical protein
VVTCVLELNDTGIAVHDGQRSLVESPGYALLDATTLIVGNEAYHNARLDPGHLNNRFWDQLSLDPLPKPTSLARHHADIAYTHLAQIWDQIRSETEVVIMAVPGSFDRQQLGLLLGMANECRMPVTGLIDTAVAASSKTLNSSERLLHLDIHLHRFVLTELERGARLRRTRVRQLTQAGQLALKEAWVEAIADAFIRTTRFDPMYSAASEQLLHERLPLWLGELQGKDHIRVEMPHKDKTFSVVLNAAGLVQAVASVYEQIKRFIQDVLDPYPHAPITLLLSHRLADLPGLTDNLTQFKNIKLLTLCPKAVALGALQHLPHTRKSDDTLSLVTDIPVPFSGPDERPPPASEILPVAEKPSHILYRARAYPISDEPITVGSKVSEKYRNLNLIGPLHGVSRNHCTIYIKENGVWLEDQSTYGTFVNGEKVRGRVLLNLGDKIRIGTPGEELQLITLVASDGA